MPQALRLPESPPVTREDESPLPVVIEPSGIDRLLALVRRHLDMEVAIVSEFVADEHVISHVEGDPQSFGIVKGGRSELDETYCWRVVEGHLPCVVPDAKAVPQLRHLEATWRADIGSYIGVPIRFTDGTVYGTLCCLSHEADASLTGRDEEFMRLCAQMVAQEVESDWRSREERLASVARIRTVLEKGRIKILFQPIFDLHTFDIVGYEALSRIDDESPEPWFAEAAEVGLDLDLERATKQATLAYLEELPQDAYLSVNLSPRAFESPTLLELFAEFGDRIVLELTEHEDVSDYAGLRTSLSSLRGGGTRFAVDDVGSGFASLRHIVRLEPDIVKLDVSLIRDINETPSLRALATSLVRFAGEVDATLIAEGVENEAEATALREAGVGYGQGFYLGLPQGLADLRSEGFPLEGAAWT